VGRTSCLVFSVLLLICGARYVCAQDQPEVRVEKGAYIVKGKWNPTDSKTGGDFAHLPVVEIHCFKAQSYCMQAIASVQGGKPGLAVQYYRVTHWDKMSILAVNYDFSCTNNALKIDMKENLILAVDSPRKKGKATSEGCSQLGHAITYKLIGEGEEKPELPSPFPSSAQ